MVYLYYQCVGRFVSHSSHTLMLKMRLVYFPVYFNFIFR